MRSSKSRSRSKSNRPRTLGNIINRVFDSSGPEGKVRGTPQQIIEKYQFLARDAQLSNDRVAAENFQQHAEHYTRMLGEAMREMAAEQETRGPQQNGNQNGNQNGQQGNGQGGNTVVSQPMNTQGNPQRDRDYRSDQRDAPRAEYRDNRSDNRPEPRDPRPDHRSEPRENRPDTRPDTRADNRPDYRAEPRPERAQPVDVIDLADPSVDDSGLVETPETRPSFMPRIPQEPAPRAERTAERTAERAPARPRSDKPRSEAPAAAPNPEPAHLIDPAAAGAEAARSPRRPRAPRKPKADAPAGSDQSDAAE